MRHPLYLYLSLIFLLLFLLPQHPRLILNQSESVPIGLYMQRTKSALTKGDIIAFKMPGSFLSEALKRKYVRDQTLLLKPIGALAGDYVCYREGYLWINNINVGKTRHFDSEGRKLPVYSECRQLASEEVFVLSSTEKSLDSRNFGALKKSYIVGVFELFAGL